MRPTSDRDRDRFAHKITRQRERGVPRSLQRSLPERWRAVCDAALAMSSESGNDQRFRRVIVAALRFALPRWGEQRRRTTDVWTRDPLNLACLAADLSWVIRNHATRGAK